MKNYNNYLLGVIGAGKNKNLDTGLDEFNLKIKVSKDVIDWLELHDKYVSECGKTIYLVNNVEYEFIGIDFNLDDFADNLKR